MDNIKKHLRIASLSKADAQADIGLINKYSLRELTPEEVFTFSVVLCDNDVDRDGERFTDAALEAMATLFVGKTGISDHAWTAANQIARLYRCQVKTDSSRTTALGTAYKCLVGDAYMLRTEDTQSMIDAIEGGIMKEVSVGCAVKSRTCSVCGKDFGWNMCQDGHVAGETYAGALCCAELDDPADAYEFSFVAVPAQRGAGVTKTFEGEGVEQAYRLMLTLSWTGHEAEARELIRAVEAGLLEAEEQAARQAILEENKHFLHHGKEE